MINLLIVRHGQTDWNKLQIMQGRTDIPLNEEGINSAKEIAKNLNTDEIDLCICSPLTRTKQTAQILIDNSKIIYDPELVERSFGDYEGKPSTFDLVERHWNYKLNDSSHGIESLLDCLKRAKSFLEKLKKNYDGKTILIVSHGCFIKALHFNMVGYDDSTDFLSFNPKNATIYKYVLN